VMDNWESAFFIALGPLDCCSVHLLQIRELHMTTIIDNG